MGLQIFWYIVIAFFWTGFFILEGFDLGVGTLHMFVGKSDLERRVAINSIGPFWDGNEVWLVVAGAGMFAAFPAWYGSMFSALYLALMLILLALIIRGVSFEYRGKSTNPRWRATWDWTLTVGSAALPVLLGIGLGDLLHGLAINQKGTFTGSFLDLLTPYGIWFGITLLALTLAHGAMYLCLKTTGSVQARSQRLARPFVWIAVLAVLGFAIWTHVQSGRGVIPAPLEALAFLLIVAGAWSVRDGHWAWGFAATTAAIAATLASFWIALYPAVMVSSTNKAYNLTVANSASGHYALGVDDGRCRCLHPVGPGLSGLELPRVSRPDHGSSCGSPGRVGRCRLTSPVGASRYHPVRVTPVQDRFLRIGSCSMPQPLPKSPAGGSRRSPITVSCRTARPTAWWLLTVPSSGSASPDRTPPACSEPFLTEGRVTSGSGPPTLTYPTSGATCPERWSWRRRGTHRRVG